MANLNLLKQLADHLLHGKLGHEQFDITNYNKGEYKEDGCGTVGCAIGECPIVWPGEWEFRFTYPKLIIMPHMNVEDCGRAFFDLSIREYRGLFMSHRQSYIDLPILDGSATKEQVANNILLFIERNK